MILPKVRDPRFVTVRRGGTLTDAGASPAGAVGGSVRRARAAACSSRWRPTTRGRATPIEAARAWTRGEVSMTQARTAGGHAMGAARDLRGAARHAAYAAGQAAVVAHVAAHELGAAAYAIKAARAAAPGKDADAVAADAGRRECAWQRDQLPEQVRALVLDDQRLRNEICWSVFDC